MINQQLIDWINAQAIKGFSRQQIKDYMIQNGYALEIAEEALNQANFPKQNNTLYPENYVSSQSQSFSDSSKQVQVQKRQKKNLDPNNLFDTQNTFVLFLLNIFSFGIYFPMWFNHIKKKTDWSYIDKDFPKYIAPFLILVIIAIVISNVFVPIASTDSFKGLFSNFDLTETQQLMIQMNVISGILMLIVWSISAVCYIINLILSFKVRKFLMQTYSEKVSGFFTFLFSTFYLQYKINKFNKSRSIESYNPNSRFLLPFLFMTVLFIVFQIVLRLYFYMV